MTSYDPVELLARAAAARQNAHAPYSGFRVGAAVVTTQGIISAGCNVENASYGLTLCAERAAVAAAVTAGTPRIVAVAIVADGPRATYPCGACRQVLAEFGDEATVVLMAGADAPDAYEQTTLGKLLPHTFRLDP